MSQTQKLGKTWKHESTKYTPIQDEKSSIPGTANFLEPRLSTVDPLIQVPETLLKMTAQGKNSLSYKSSEG